MPSFKTVQINVMGYYVKSIAKMMKVKIYIELYMHKCCAVNIF